MNNSYPLALIRALIQRELTEHSKGCGVFLHSPFKTPSVRTKRITMYFPELQTYFLPNDPPMFLY